MSTLPDTRPRPASDLLFGGPDIASVGRPAVGPLADRWLETPTAARDAAPTYCAWPSELLAD